MSSGISILLCTVVGWCFVARVSGDVLPVYHQELTTSKYLYQSSLPAISEFTICFWINMESNDDRKDDYFVSIARTGQHNELVIGWNTNGVMVLHNQNSITKIPTCCDDMSQLFSGWHKHCFTWKAGGQIKWYADKHVSGEMVLLAAVPAPTETIRSGGFLTLMQEQDSINGGFDLGQTVPGRLAEFNMWNHEMSSEEIRTETCGCGAKGSVVSWDTLQEQGTSIRSHDEFPYCKGKSMVYHQEHTTSKYLYQSTLPAMSQSTICFWLRMEDGDDRTNDYFVSYAISGQNNELVFGLDTNKKLNVHVRGGKILLNILGGNTISDLFTGWHKHCLTWRAGGDLKWYTDRHVEGRLELVASAAASGSTVRGGGFLALLQEQDNFDGGYDITQTVPGRIASFNMWQHEMSLKQLNSDTCETSGTVSSWKTLKERGNSIRSYTAFAECTGNSEVYHQERTISKHLYQSSGIPTMSQSTICFWLRIDDGDDRTNDYFVSYAISGSNNELVFGLDNNKKLNVHIRGGKILLNLVGGNTISDLFNGWHKHCLTWRAGGDLKWYTDRHVAGHMELVASAAASGSTIRGGGYLALLQEQDGVDSGYDVSQTTPGKLSKFNMWQHEMTLAELNSETCDDSGTVASWNTLEEKGISSRSYNKFPCPV